MTDAHPLLPPNSPAVDFSCETQLGPMPSFAEHVRGRWTVFVAHPRDATPICSTEMLELLRLEDEFARRKVAVVGLSTDTVEEHVAWLRDLERVARGKRVWFPVVADVRGDVARAYGMLARRRLKRARAGAESESESAASDAAAEPYLRDRDGRLLASRTVYVIGPDFFVEHVAVSPMNTGRSFAEILRVVDSLQVTAAQSLVGTPASWRGLGDRVVMLPTSADRAAARPALADDLPPLAKSDSGFSVVGAAPGSTASAPHSPVASAPGAGSVVEVDEVVTPYLSFASVKPLFAKRFRVDGGGGGASADADASSGASPFGGEAASSATATTAPA